MKIISDIRLYKSELENIDGSPFPVGFGGKGLNVKLHRVVMKLREQRFSLGDFDHLYLNFTTCGAESEITPAKRSVDRYHPWYRYYDVSVSKSLFDRLNQTESEKDVLGLTEMALMQCFSTSEFGETEIHRCFEEALTMGEGMLMRFKEKKTAKRHAVLYLRYLDDGRYRPLLRVFDLDGELMLEEDLEPMAALDALGEIRLSAKQVTIKPRKNICANKLEPVRFEIRDGDEES